MKLIIYIVSFHSTTSAVMQVYLKSVLESFLHPQPSVRMAALHVVNLILRQGLVHPVQVGSITFQLKHQLWPVHKRKCIGVDLHSRTHFSPSLVSHGRRHPSILGPAHTMPEELENRVLTLKTYQIFSVHTTLEEFENVAITGHFGFVFEENWDREITC